MKFQMHENSLFAVLLRSPWWVSALVAAGLFALVRVWLEFIFALFAALPFLVIGAVVAWKQLRQPSSEAVAKKLEKIRALPAEEFVAALEAGFRKEGYGVAKPETLSADLELSKGGRVSLVVARRWKAAHVGVEPLKELEALRARQKADECVYIAAGQWSEAAVKFAEEKKFRVITGPGLVQLIP